MLALPVATEQGPAAPTQTGRENRSLDGNRQTTLKGHATVSGIALHTGRRVNLTMRPAGPDSGVRFRRVDLPDQPELRALIQNVIDTRRATTIAEGDAKVHTTEHILASFNALGVDNVTVDMTGPEPPILDGSAKPFVEMIQAAGLIEQEAPRSWIDIKEAVYLEAGETRMVILPDKAFRISCTVKYNATPMDCQYLSLELTAESFAGQLCEARTFCLYHEIEPLMAANLICGGSLDNAVVIKGDAILSKEGLRYPDEFVRHKTLDIVGDLYLLGQRLHGHVIAIKPGHPANVALARKISEQRQIWSKGNAA